MRIGFLILISLSLWSCEGGFLKNEYQTKLDESIAAIEAYGRKNNLNLSKDSETGIYYTKQVAVPNGRTPQKEEVAHISYTLSVLNGQEIATASRKDSVIYNQYAASVIEGFIRSFYLLKEGEKATFLIPMNLAWANSSPGNNIPVYATIKLDMELHKLYNETEQIDTYIKLKKWENVASFSDGLKVHKTPATGTLGAAVDTTGTYEIKYKGSLLNDQVFDSGTFTFTLGKKEVIPGFEKGIAQLKEGETATVVFPSSLGYSSRGSGGIPPFAPLAFEVTVVAKK